MRERLQDPTVSEALMCSVAVVIVGLATLPVKSLDTPSYEFFFLKHFGYFLKNFNTKPVILRFYCFLHDSVCSYVVLMSSVKNRKVKSHEDERKDVTFRK